MFRRYAGMTLAALFCAATIAIAQTPPTNQQPNPAEQERPPQQAQPAPERPTETKPMARADEKTVTLVGCLQREENVPGREPNIAERAGILEDYILTNASMKQESGSTAQSQETTGTSGMAAGSKSYKVTRLDDERLQAHLGKRVEVTGTLTDMEEAHEEQRETAGTAGVPDELPELEATGIREVAGECPAPANR